jgi:Flp pilus assembly protein TadD
MPRFTVSALALCAALALNSTAVLAADSETTPASMPKSDDYAQAKTAIQAKKWQQASDLLTKVVAKEPKNADAYNLLGYSLRWQERYPQAFEAYDKALALDPKHKGALEYSGIAYLKTGQKDKALAQLDRLQKICATCEETADLAKALAQAK